MQQYYHLDIQAIKCYLKSVQEDAPWYLRYENPFAKMKQENPRLWRKLHKGKEGNRSGAALTEAELKRILRWLERGDTVRAAEDYAIVLTLSTSGLRSAELLQLRWKDLEKRDDSYNALFTGKGGREDQQELYPEAVKALRRYFRKQFDRASRPDEALLWTQPNRYGTPARPLSYNVLHKRVVKLGEKARKAGLLERDIRLTPHCFRRTFATLLYKKGMGLKVIRRLTRHQSIQTLTDFYVIDSESPKGYFDQVFHLGTGVFVLVIQVQHRPVFWCHA